MLYDRSDSIPISVHGLLAGIIFALIGVSPGAEAASPILALPTGKATPVGVQEMGETPKGEIRIQIKDRSLKDVLQRIQNASGVRFEISSSLMDTPLTATLTAPDWTTATRRLLRNFNRAEVLDKKRLDRVLILESARAQDTPPIYGGEVHVIEQPSPVDHGLPVESAGTANAPPGVSSPPKSASSGPPASQTSSDNEGPPIGQETPDGSGPPGVSTGPPRVFSNP